MNRIDILIPVIEKDLNVLPYVIDSVKKNVSHPIGEIFIVAPESTKIQNLCTTKKCNFINENTVLPITKKDINYFPIKQNNRVDRSGWLFQQLLKLSGDTLGVNKGFLVMDADTILISPHVFEQNGKTVFFLRQLYYKPYFSTYKRLFGEDAKGPGQSRFFVSHYMYFKKNRLQEMKRMIESKHNTNWYTAILNCINKNQWDSFSEYETYGNFMIKSHLDEMIFKPRRNLSLKSSSVKNISKIDTKSLAGKNQIRSISFHSWNR